MTRRVDGHTNESSMPLFRGFILVRRSGARAGGLQAQAGRAGGERSTGEQAAGGAGVASGRRAGCGCGRGRAGPVVLDLQAVLVAAYAVVTALAVPLAAHAFRRHQVQ